MSRSLSRWQAVVLGIVILAGLGLGAWALFAQNHHAWRGNDSFHVVAGFADVGGVEVGTRVRLQGMDAGEVEAIVPPRAVGEPVCLHLRLAGKYRHLIGHDARVQIAGDGLVMGKIIRLVLGSADAAAVSDGAALRALPAADLGDELAQAGGKLNAVLGQLEAALREFRRGDGPIGKAADDLHRAAAGLDKVLTQADALLQEVRGGEGTLGKLVKHEEAYAEALASLKDVRKMVDSVKQNADAIKSLPVIRNYVVDLDKELIRPHCKRWRWWLQEDAIFEPGTTAITPYGRQKIREAGEWLNTIKYTGTEIVVAVYAGPGHSAEVAGILSQKQAESIVEHLRDLHRVHRTGFWWWNTRAVKALGCGQRPAAVPDSPPLPSPRIEFLAFAPR